MMPLACDVVVAVCEPLLCEYVCQCVGRILRALQNTLAVVSWAGRVRPSDAPCSDLGQDHAVGEVAFVAGDTDVSAV